jgi:hypothetical protein
MAWCAVVAITTAWSIQKVEPPNALTQRHPWLEPKHRSWRPFGASRRRTDLARSTSHGRISGGISRLRSRASINWLVASFRFCVSAQSRPVRLTRTVEACNVAVAQAEVFYIGRKPLVSASVALRRYNRLFKVYGCRTGRPFAFRKDVSNKIRCDNTATP